MRTLVAFSEEACRYAFRHLGGPTMCSQALTGHRPQDPKLKVPLVEVSPRFTEFT